MVEFFSALLKVGLNDCLIGYLFDEESEDIRC